MPRKGIGSESMEMLVLFTKQRADPPLTYVLDV